MGTAALEEAANFTRARSGRRRPDDGTGGSTQAAAPIVAPKRAVTGELRARGACPRIEEGA